MAQIKVREIIFNRDPAHPNETHMVILDREDRAWERYSNMEIGAWGRIQLPEEPESEESSGQPPMPGDSKPKDQPP